MREETGDGPDALSASLTASHGVALSAWHVSRGNREPLRGRGRGHLV